jgi:hypothetical protein
MGKIASAATIYAVAYLTEKGRTYLFNKSNVRFDTSGNDLFEIKTFTLGDPDTNYRTTERLASGDVPDITGKSEGCLKATTDYTQTIFTYYTIDSAALANPLYQTNVVGNTLTVNTDVTFPTNSSSDVPPTSGGGTSTPGGGIGGGVLVGGTATIGGSFGGPSAIIGGE